MLSNRKTETMRLPELPSAFLTSANERKLLIMLISDERFLSNAFNRQFMDKIIQKKFADNLAYTNSIRGLINHGIIYRLVRKKCESGTVHEDDCYLDDACENNWYLHAEKTVQALLNYEPELLLGKKILKFEYNNITFDGGFIEKELNVFGIVMDKITNYLGNDSDASYDFPNFLRLYEYIGHISAEGFYSNYQRVYKRAQEDTIKNLNVTDTLQNILNNHHKDQDSFEISLDDEKEVTHTTPIDHEVKTIYIPKYRALKRVTQNTWENSNNNVCVSIS